MTRPTAAYAEIIGESEKIIHEGSMLRLVCVVRRSTEPPSYVFWYFENRMINYDLSKWCGNGVSVHNGRQTSELVIGRAEPRHAGNYTCVPANARAASVTVHVVQNFDLTQIKPFASCLGKLIKLLAPDVVSELVVAVGSSTESTWKPRDSHSVFSYSYHQGTPSCISLRFLDLKLLTQPSTGRGPLTTAVTYAVTPSAFKLIAHPSILPWEESNPVPFKPKPTLFTARTPPLFV
ncbi:hypothetical protein EVAR_63961_1 [Eumeta japonica]|uniref:Ig-like domain-containing protein n=1 Tax=Eumeta variegata TaxID=151549 RepID=A0A4C2A068_EUMVA|nr:hypothetical protein EVAR_63961_1 [Eumeta japonica]